MDSLAEFAKNLKDHQILKDHIKNIVVHPKQVLKQNSKFPSPVTEMSNREFEVAKMAGVLYSTLNRLIEQLEMGTKTLTDGCDKNWCLGTDGRWPKCPNCGSVWDDKLGSRVIE